MLTFGIRIILLLLLISGAIALIGDYIGRSIGRRRIALFSLRPRYTAMAITVASGILIAITTVGIILTVSRDARTALFGMDELKRDLAERGQLLKKTKDELFLKTGEIKKAQREIFFLEKTKTKLSKEVEISRKGKFLFTVGEALLTSTIQAGPEREKLERGLRQIISAADAYVKSYGSKEESITVSPEDFKSAVLELEKRKGISIVMVTVAQNTLLGEEVPANLEIKENKLVFKEGQKIAEIAIAPGLSVPEIEQKIKELLALTHITAKNAGVLADPAGSIGSVPYSQIFSLARKLKNYKKEVILRSTAKTDINSIGPLEIDFKI